MKITTKFDVHDLVKHKYDIPEEGQINALEVLEITTSSCYVDTQVVYACRPIVAMEAKKVYGGGVVKYMKIAHGISNKDMPVYQKYREDELILIDEESIKIIKNIKD